jgi:hypothetical protein
MIYDDKAATARLFDLIEGHKPVADPLALRAARLWPDSPALQAEWMRAVRVVRSTSRGWLLDRRVPPLRGAL